MPYQGKQGNINIIVGWAESALVQVSIDPLFLSSHLFVAGGQDDQCLLPC